MRVVNRWPSFFRLQFVSLRTKLVLFISLIIIIVCSGLSWYFFQQQAESTTRHLVDTGMILAKGLAHNSRYAAITEDKTTMNQFIDGVLEDDEVVYAIITSRDGELLAAKTKGRLTEGRARARSPDLPLYPDPALAEARFRAASPEPSLATFVVEGGGMAETIYDFSVPIFRRGQQPDLLPFSLEAPESAEPQAASKVLAVVQIGLTDAKMQQKLDAVVWNVALITGLMILIGIAATVVLADRIIMPLKSLAGTAARVAEGDLGATVTPSTQDEVGQLATMFNRMIQFMKERDEAISKQLMQLKTLNRTEAALTSTLDIDKLLSTVLHLLVEHLGYRRLLLMQYDPHRQVAFGARVAGVPEEVEQQVGGVELPVVEDGSIQAEMLLHGRSVLITDIEAVAPRLHPPLLTLARQVGMTSFVCAPLKGTQYILGFVGADRGEEPCTQEDLDLLTTIAHNIAVALDNARAYQELAKMTQTLEQRVRERTQELQAANEKLQELDRLKSAFVSIVSHELRTPMTSIKGYVENMLDGLTGALTERQAYYLSRVKFNTERLTRMINDLLDLSRIEAGRVELHLTTIPVQALVLEITEALQPMAHEKGLSLQAHQEGGPMEIRADRDKLHQILTNLIQNALKFTPKGGEIRVETRLAEEGVAQFCVVDTGCGIPPHELPKVFERFYRGEYVQAEQRGAGLGLAITKSLVELHGGRIWAESTVGQGSRFFFTMPLASS